MNPYESPQCVEEMRGTPMRTAWTIMAVAHLVAFVYEVGDPMGRGWRAYLACAFVACLLMRRLR